MQLHIFFIDITQYSKKPRGQLDILMTDLLFVMSGTWEGTVKWSASVSQAYQQGAAWRDVEYTDKQTKQTKKHAKC